ncbi:type ISP restriction/modification enzyme [Streptomyces tendae]|uniref:type ISP restriction/modification enzyme n=1 Tax=Streptomyces tendae TaxID=1932 RepID=UPI00364A22E3
MDEFDIGEAEPTTEPRGTLCEAFGGEDLDVLADERARSSLTAAFATYLEKYPDVRIEYDGRDLDPAAEQLHAGDYVLDAPSGGASGEPARLRVVEWRRPVPRALFLCDAEGMSRAQLKPGIQAPGFEFTAHLSWSGFEDVDSEQLAFTDWAPDGPLTEMLAAAREQLRAHFRARVDQRRREQVAEWRRDGIYPYATDPADERERAERETFDAVATTVFRHLPKSKGTRRTTFALLRSVLSHEPSDVLRIADELFALSKQERDELIRLLERTTLSALIKASTAVADRIDFLTALEHLVFAPETKPRVKERDGLHRILEDRCWVFGEEYALHVSDGLLHSPAYREAYAADLKKSLPRIPKVRAFRAFAEAGRRLSELHIGYESAKPFGGVVISLNDTRPDMPEADLFRVTKMKIPKTKGVQDRTRIVYNHHITLENIPEEAYEYQLGARSAIEWIIDRYQVKTDPKSGILNDPNEWSEEPRYVVDLLRRIVTVSLATVEIVKHLPPLDIIDDAG